MEHLVLLACGCVVLGVVTAGNEVTVKHFGNTEYAKVSAFFDESSPLIAESTLFMIETAFGLT